MDEKKKRLALALVSGKPGGEESEDEEMGEDYGGGPELPTELLDAIKAGDAEGLASALREFVKSC